MADLQMKKAGFKHIIDTHKKSPCVSLPAWTRSLKFCLLIELIATEIGTPYTKLWLHFAEAV